MDYFKGKTNEDFITYFLECLNCRKEFIQYTYPHEFTEPEDVTDEHIIRCQTILIAYIRNLVIETTYEASVRLPKEAINEIVGSKVEELNPVMNSLIMAFIEEASVTYIDLSPPNIEMQE